MKTEYIMSKMKGMMVMAGISLLLVSCGNSKLKRQKADWSGVDTVMFDAAKTPQIMREMAIDSVWYVKLESVEESMMGWPDEVIFGDSTIIIADKRIARAVLLFDFQGKYVGRISRLGNGPEEYLSLSGISRLPDGSIAIYDIMKQRIGIFEERGRNISFIECPVHALSVQFIDDRTMVFDSFVYRNEETLLEEGGYASFLVKNSNMKDMYKFGVTDFEVGFNYTRSRTLYSYDGKVYCNVNFEDVIYEMGRKGAKARYELVMKPAGVSSHLPAQTEDEFDALMMRYSFFSGNFIELKDYSYFNISAVKPKPFEAHLIYCHKNRQSYVLMNDFNDPMMAFFSTPEYRFGDNCLVSCYSSSNIISNVFYMEEKSDDPAIRELVDGMNRDDNPVLFFYRMAI